MSGVELKNCPFCGGHAAYITPHNGGNPYVMCVENHCTQPHPDAIAAWNTRTPAPAQIRADALREAMGPINYWLDRFGHVQIKHVPAQKYATDAILDIQDAILALIDAPLSPTAVDDSPAPDADGKEGV